jgi:hypothetical protein
MEHNVFVELAYSFNYYSKIWDYGTYMIYLHYQSFVSALLKWNKTVTIYSNYIVNFDGKTWISRYATFNNYFSVYRSLYNSENSASIAICIHIWNFILNSFWTYLDIYSNNQTSLSCLYSCAYSNPQNRHTPICLYVPRIYV